MKSRMTTIGGGGDGLGPPGMATSPRSPRLSTFSRQSSFGSVVSVNASIVSIGDIGDDEGDGDGGVVENEDISDDF